MSQDVPAFQALPGATPQNSAFIDLYFDPSISLPGKSTVSITINGWSMRLSAGQFVRVAVPPGPVFYRASILNGDPGALSIGKHHGMSRTEKGSLIFALVVLLSILVIGATAVVPLLIILSRGMPE